MKKNENKNKKGIIIGVSALALVLICGGGYIMLNNKDSKLVSNNIEQVTINNEGITKEEATLFDETEKDSTENTTNTNEEQSTETTSLGQDTTIAKNEKDKKDKVTEETSVQKETKTTTTKKEETTKKQVVTEKQTEATTQATTKAPVKEATQTTTKKPEPTTQTTTKEPITESTTKAPSNNGGGSSKPNYNEMTDEEFWDTIGKEEGVDINSFEGGGTGEEFGSTDKLSGNVIGQ